MATRCPPFRMARLPFIRMGLLSPNMVTGACRGWVTGVGFAVGPAFGGLLSDRFGLSFVPLVSTVGSVTSLVWCWWMLENPTPHTRKDTQIEEDSVELRPLMAPEFTDEFESESIPPGRCVLSQCWG